MGRPVTLFTGQWADLNIVSKGRSAHCPVNKVTGLPMIFLF